MKMSKDVGLEETEVDMTPMIDVTFLLLIFFVIVSTLTRMETEAEVELPAADQAQVDDTIDVTQLVINVEEDGDIFIIGQQCTEDQVSAILANEAKKSKGPDGFSERSIVVRGHEKVEYSRIQWLMKQCLENGIWKLRLAALAPQ